MARHSIEPRECRLIFRCTDRERQRLTSAARTHGLSFSDFARDRLLGEGPEPRMADARLPAPHVDGATRDLAFQVRRIGVNLHQIVKHMNYTNAPPPAELASLLELIRHYVEKADAR